MPRRVIAFIGGIDLCDGRYDTHDHPLFRTLQLEHKRDFYQDCLPGVDGEAGGAYLNVHTTCAGIVGRGGGAQRWRPPVCSDWQDFPRHLRPGTQWYQGSSSIDI